MIELQNQMIVDLEETRKRKEIEAELIKKNEERIQAGLRMSQLHKLESHLAANSPRYDKFDRDRLESPKQRNRQEVEHIGLNLKNTHLYAITYRV